MVWQHPDTGQESIIISASTYGVFEEQLHGAWTRHSRPDTEVLLRELYSHGLTPSNTLCVNLEPGTTVIWDNRMVLHRSTPQKEYLAAKQERLMHRVFVVQDTGESGISEEAEGDTSLSPKM